MSGTEKHRKWSATIELDIRNGVDGLHTTDAIEVMISDPRSPDLLAEIKRIAVDEAKSLIKNNSQPDVRAIVTIYKERKRHGRRADRSLIVYEYGGKFLVG